jgi:hypothetical protein
MALARRPLASTALDGQTTFKPGIWVKNASGDWEW